MASRHYSLKSHVNMAYCLCKLSEKYIRVFAIASFNHIVTAELFPGIVISWFVHIQCILSMQYNERRRQRMKKKTYGDCATRALNNSTWMAIIWHTWWFLLTAKTLHFHIYLWVNGCELLQRIRCHEPLNGEPIIQQKFADLLQIWCAHWKCVFNWRFKDVTFRICQLIYPGIFMKCLNLFGYDTNNKKTHFISVAYGFG